ncbi:membrane protein [Alicyclobacillus acidoterrestris]|uniref:YeeE/YedE family protein n=1 Tax=Alicyclobacillus suci TaxID=2816080 RepID=UPI001191B0E2|nr:YeeE/YedE family protein [Alicyclobacillus suci]GEO25003.1 membrane protein [Alicyclobacillus acidoterrestris]
MAVSDKYVSLDTQTRTTSDNGSPKINRGFTAFALILFVVGTLYLGFAVSWTMALLYLVGGILGITLYHARYGFTSSWRNFLTNGRGVGIRAQMVMFLIANIVFLPILLVGHAFGHAVAGYVYPVGFSLLAGAFLFGIGMQVADGCASGTLYHTGGGDVRGILTIIGFVIGSVLGSWNFAWWQSTPHFQPVSFLMTFGDVGGFLFNVLLMAIVFVTTIIIERRKHGKIESMVAGGKSGLNGIFRGPWSLLAGSIVLALGNAVVLLLSGKPWGVTSAFALWGAKMGTWLGIPVTSWGYWQTPANAHALHSSVLSDPTTILDLAVMFGALLAAAVAGKMPRPYFRRFPARMIIGVTLGGIIMGYGARISFGCNIGAYTDGIASFSLHGWIWMICAIVGSSIGIALRPLIALSTNRK